MFLWQKFNYKMTFIDSEEKFDSFEKELIDKKPRVVAFDTETTGLHIIKDKPFLIGVGFLNSLFVFEPSKERFDRLYMALIEIKPIYFIAHNAKFDYHMLRNIGSKLPKEIPIADTLALARLTDYVDSFSSLGLEALGAEHVDSDSKFASKVIKEHLNQINKVRYAKIKEYVKNNLKISYTKFKELYDNRVQFVDSEYEEHFNKIDEIAPKANYEDSYKEKPTLMINYLADDVLLVLRLFDKLIPILDIVDKGRKTWNRENRLIRVVGDMEANGMSVDVSYLLNQRQEMINYIGVRYDTLHKLVGEKFTVGQHKVIKQIFSEKYKIGMLSTDEDALTEVMTKYDGEVTEVASIILELRTLEKWLSTYVNGMLNRIYNNKVYTDINNSGAATGRVSSDLQQQPKYSIKSIDGVELFHPRKVFVNEKGMKNYYIDFSNMELRVQAYYTLLTSSGDVAMCRAFMPFMCTNIVTGELFDPQKDLNEWNSGLWVTEDGNIWEKTDLHSHTTKYAFKNIDESSEDWDNYRDLGKRANFLKNYGGGKKALMSKLKIDEDVADALDKAYYDAFPKILDYQRWVDAQVRTYGKVSNLFGRQYYFKDTSFAYKAYNYLIQGSCADYVKQKEIEIYDFLIDKKSKMLMPVHDELIFSISPDEEHIIEEIKNIMEDASVMMPLVPMVAEVSTTETNWAEKTKI